MTVPFIESTSQGEAAGTSAAWASPALHIRRLMGLSVRTIVIDAGHGGHDPGTIGEMGTREKDVALDVALRLRRRLERSGAYRILLVRGGDVFVPLSERAEYANSNNADLFVSIHVNYLPRTSTNAVQTWYFGRHEDREADRLAERENRDSQYALSDFERIARQLGDTLKLQESKSLAASIQASLLASLRRQNRKVHDAGVRTAPFVVLLGVKSPSVLVEIASLSSPDAEQQLGVPEYRDEIASSISDGITRYLGNHNQGNTHGHDSYARQ
jgi:N-acetylmuramoyl-L-alanine amidase